KMPRHKRDLRAKPRKFNCARPPDALCAAADQRIFAFQCEHGSITPCRGRLPRCAASGVIADAAAGEWELHARAIAGSAQMLQVHSRRAMSRLEPGISKGVWPICPDQEAPIVSRIDSL